jgi:PAS domain S-box-containing protein
MMNITLGGVAMPTEDDKSGEQKAAESEVEGFKERSGPFVVAAETTRMPMVFTDAKEPSNPIIFANDSILALTGYRRDEMLARSLDFPADCSTDPEAMAAINTGFDADAGEEREISCRRKDGSVFWASVWFSPVRGADGKVVQHFLSFVDLTKHKRQAEHLHFLLDELNHRTQNTLATVLAIAGQTLRGPLTETVVGLFEGRVLALSQAHGLLGRKDWDDVGLLELIEAILEPFGLQDSQAARFSIRGDAVRLQPKVSLTLAVVFHELATNSEKYGALSDASAGQVKIDWQTEVIAAGERLRLRWQEVGGPPVTPPSHKGFGWRLIELGLPQELDGEVHLDFRPEGLVCQIMMPLPGAKGHE